MVKTTKKMSLNESLLKREKLQQEFLKLKDDIFHGEKFVEYEINAKTRRYDQLLGFFFPQFRTDGWTNPMFEQSGSKRVKKTKAR